MIDQLDTPAKLGYALGQLSALLTRLEPVERTSIVQRALWSAVQAGRSEDGRQEAAHSLAARQGWQVVK